MSTDPYEELPKLKIGSLQQNLPFKGKGWHTQQKPRATNIQRMDYREVRNRHRSSKKVGTTNREGWKNSIRSDTPNSKVVKNKLYIFNYLNIFKQLTKIYPIP